MPRALWTDRWRPAATAVGQLQVASIPRLSGAMGMGVPGPQMSVWSVWATKESN